MLCIGERAITHVLGNILCSLVFPVVWQVEVGVLAIE